VTMLWLLGVPFSISGDFGITMHYSPLDGRPEEPAMPCPVALALCALRAGPQPTRQRRQPAAAASDQRGVGRSC